MAKNGRAKGSRGEREVAKLVCAWWARREPKCQFAKTPLSGGWSSPQMRGEFKVAGDLVTTAQHWPFTVEVKRREVSFANLWKARASPVWAWWIQTQAAAIEEGREPMLWFRRNREPWRVMLAEDFALSRPINPVRAWSREELRAVQYGERLPACYLASCVLGSDPKVWVCDGRS